MRKRRKLFGADNMLGHTLLLKVDGAGRFGRLESLRYDPIDIKIARHRGRVDKTTGVVMHVKFARGVAAARIVSG
jgi:hypothetical protein